MSRNDRKQHNDSSSSDDDDDDNCINLCDDHDYQVLSSIFETDNGDSVADILFSMKKDIHSIAKDIKLLTRSIHQLIQYSLMSNMNQKNPDDSD